MNYNVNGDWTKNGDPQSGQQSFIMEDCLYAFYATKILIRNAALSRIKQLKTAGLFLIGAVTDL